MCKKGGCTGAKLGWLLMLVGALNWGLVGLGGFFDGNWNVVNLLLGSWPWLEWVVYILVGLAGLMSLFHCKCSKCKVAAAELPKA